MLFVCGGVATLILGIGFLFLLPESVEFLAHRNAVTGRELSKVNAILRKLKRDPLTELPAASDQQRAKRASLTNLFRDGHAIDTVFLWFIYFLGFLTLYFLLSWIPSLFVAAGFSRSAGTFALTIHNLGAVVGIILIGLLTTRIRLAKPIGVFFLGSAMCLACLFVFRPTDLLVLNSLIFLIGILLQGGFTAMYALAARVYPTAIRATGIGWGAGLGRVGAVVSPILAGVLSTAGWDLYSLSLLFTLPVLLASLLVVRFKV
jgi:cyanate permease